jgi:omega-6 fatty acid desaturase (delta-12 desaturase)
LTGNIGLHHVHHLNARIPNYRLTEVLRAHPELWSVPKLTFLQSLRCARLALWDETHRKLVGFRRIRDLQPTT